MSVSNLLDEAVRAYLLEDQTRLSEGYKNINFDPLIESLRNRYAEVRRRRIPWLKESLIHSAHRVVQQDEQLLKTYRKYRRLFSQCANKRSRVDDDQSIGNAKTFGTRLDEFLASEEFLTNVKATGQLVFERNDQCVFLRKIRSLLIGGSFRSEPRTLAHSLCLEFDCSILAEVECDCALKSKEAEDLLEKVERCSVCDDYGVKVVMLHDLHRMRFKNGSQRFREVHENLAVLC
ncbi:hypothetical protein ACOME3_005478 [Neoechinorhynchus agilis]